MLMKSLLIKKTCCSWKRATSSIPTTKNITIPNAKIFYASVGRDYSYIKKLNHTIYEWYGCLTNESETLTQSECAEMSVISKFVVYPWENVEEELEEVNASMIYHNNKTE